MVSPQLERVFEMKARNPAVAAIFIKFVNYQVGKYIKQIMM
jgi:hypothetical protein